MSAVDMANMAIARRSTARAPQRAVAGAATPSRIQEHARIAEGSNAPADNPFTAAMKLITTYIPAEVLTLYVAGTGILLSNDPAAPAGTTPVGARAGWTLFWVFLIATPAFNWLVFAAKLKAKGERLPFSPSNWPVWEMAAASIAFAAWASALPNFVGRGVYPAELAGFVVLIVVTVLGLVSPLIGRQRT